MVPLLLCKACEGNPDVGERCPFCGASTPDLTIGEFITVPAWNVTGCVIDIRPAMLGSGDAFEALLQAETGETRWYRLEPHEYTVCD